MSGLVTVMVVPPIVNVTAPPSPPGSGYVAGAPLGPLNNQTRGTGPRTSAMG